MKQPKRLTRNQKELLKKKGLNWKEWMLLEETTISYVFVHKKTKQEFTVWTSADCRRNL